MQIRIMAGPLVIYTELAVCLTLFSFSFLS